MNRWTLAAFAGISVGMGAQHGVAQAQDSVGASSVASGDVAQASTAATGRLADVLPAAYSGSSCMSGLTQAKVKRAVATFKEALESETPEAKVRGLQEAEQALVEVLSKDKQEKNAAAWFSLGQVYLYRDNVAGADTALARATKLAPGCRADIDDLRYTAWAPLINGGIELSKAKNNDSALVRFRQASLIRPDNPQGALSAGVLFANSGQLDSAAVYFSLAADVADRAKMPEERNRATFNLAAMFQQLSRHAEAAAALEKYLGWMPDDRDAKDALATSYRAAGEVEKAQALEKDLLATAGPGDTAATVTTGETTRRPASVAATAMRVGINLYNDQKYDDAAAAFLKVLEVEPNNRDAIYNLANTYFAMKSAAKLVETSKLLLAIEPMSESALQLLGNGYKNANDIDKAVKVAERLLAMPIDVAVKEFVTRSQEVKLTMTATGRAAQTPVGKAIAAVPVSLSFEFLDGTGAVVASQECEVPAMKADQVHEFTLEGKGKGIVAWRYAVKK